jgi:hypothetical protein
MGAQWLHGSTNNPLYSLMKSLNLLDEATKSKNYFTLCIMFVNIRYLINLLKLILDQQHMQVKTVVLYLNRLLIK